MQAPTVSPRRVPREPLDVSKILAPSPCRNKQLHVNSRSLFYNIEDQHVAEVASRYNCNLELVQHHAQLLEWIGLGVHRARSDEAKEAVRALVKSVTSTIMRQALRDGNRTPHQPHPNPLLRNGPISRKSLSELHKRFLTSCLIDQRYSHGDIDAFLKLKTDALRKLKKEAGNILENQVELWLETQGIRHWTSGIAANAEDEVFFLTEHDLMKSQTEEFGKPLHTPDFLFVDVNKNPVQIPIILESRQDRIKGSVDFWATVLEVKGRFTLPHITSLSPDRQALDNDRYHSSLANQLNRYIEYFGPTLMFQKKGITRSSLEYIANECGSGSGDPIGHQLAVVTFDLHALPDSNLPNIWKVDISENRHGQVQQLLFPHGRHNVDAKLIDWFRTYDKSGTAEMFSDDIQLLNQLREKVFIYTIKHFGGPFGGDKFVANKQDEDLYNGWEGRLFVQYVKKANDFYQQRLSSELSAAAAADDAPTNPSFVITLQCEVPESWEDIALEEEKGDDIENSSSESDDSDGSTDTSNDDIERERS